MDRHLRQKFCRMRCALIAVLATTLSIAMMANSAFARPTLTSASSVATASLPHANSEFIHPTERHQLFFVQRTTNANTVVYVAQFDQHGRLDRQNPVAVYWRRFAGKGHIKALRWYERAFGFGVKTRLIANNSAPGKHTYQVALNALRSHPFELRQTAPFKAALWLQQENRDFQMIYSYLDVDETGLLPKVTRLRLYTSDPETGLYMTHTIAVSGGAFRE